MNQLTFPVTESAAKKAGIKYSSEENKNSKFASRLRDLRKSAGLSQEALSRSLGCSKSTLGQYETGDTLPDAKTLESMAGIFSVSADYLLCLSDTKTPNIQTKEIIAQTGLSEKAVFNICTLNSPLFKAGLCTFLENMAFITSCTEFGKLLLNVALAKEYEQSTPYQGEDLNFTIDDAYHGILLQGYDACEYMYQKLIHEFSEAVDAVSGLRALREEVAIKRREGLPTFLDSLSKLSSEDE